MSIELTESDFDYSRMGLESARAELRRRRRRYGESDPRTMVARLILEERERQAGLGVGREPSQRSSAFLG